MKDYANKLSVENGPRVVFCINLTFTICHAVVKIHKTVVLSRILKTHCDAPQSIRTSSVKKKTYTKITNRPYFI